VRRTVLAIPMTQRVRSRKGGLFVRDVFAGIGYLRRNRAAGAISLDLFAVLFGGATALLPGSMRRILFFFSIFFFFCFFEFLFHFF